MTNNPQQSTLPSPHDFYEYDMSIAAGSNPIHANTSRFADQDRARTEALFEEITVRPISLSVRPYEAYHELIHVLWVSDTTRFVIDLEKYVQRAHAPSEVAEAVYSSSDLAPSLRALVADGRLARLVYYVPNALVTHAASIGHFDYPDDVNAGRPRTVLPPNQGDGDAARFRHDVRRIVWRHYRPGVELFLRREEEAGRALFRGVYRRGMATHEALQRSIGGAQIRDAPEYWAELTPETQHVVRD